MKRVLQNVKYIKTCLQGNGFLTKTILQRLVDHIYIHFKEMGLDQKLFFP